MVEMVIEARRRSLGGFDVGRVLPFAARRMVGPFVFFDHMGPLTLPAPVPRETDVRPHPHIGLATVTYLFDGEIMHRDSTGAAQAIRPGEVNWMTAGRGVTHSERFDGMRAKGGAVHGVQAWVALPREQEEAAPAFDHYSADAAPRFEAEGVSGRVIAGEAYGIKSPVKTLSPLFYAHADLLPGARLAAPGGASERAAYIVRGQVACDGQSHGAGRMLIFGAGEAPVLTAETAALVLLIGGEPLGERFLFWNFVASSKERLEAAKADWRAGRFALPPGDDQEFIPLPADTPGGQ
ncbi:MAG: pirin family protein [Hyphomonadaceae bacterium]